MKLDAFLARLDALPNGYSAGQYEGRRYGVTKTVKSAGKQAWLFAEDLGGADRISFNLYLLDAGPQLKPCEMPAEKVIAFVMGFEPAAAP